jgi:all-trans-8'-apo-beta-carotenal 15,15'-oxygenase
VYGEYQPIPDLFATVSPGRPVRYRIALDSRKIIERTVMDYDRTPDFPSIDPALASGNYDDFWMLGISASGQQGRKFFNQLAHGNWSQGGVAGLFQAQPGEYLAGEPVYAARPHHPGEGVVIVELIDTNTNQAAFLLFDAAQVSSGPIARLPLRHRQHPVFHASFFHT